MRGASMSVEVRSWLGAGRWAVEVLGVRKGLSNTQYPTPQHPFPHSPILPIVFFLCVLCVLCGSLPGRTAPGAPVREVNLWVARDAAPAPRVRLTLNTQNVPVVHMSAFRLDGVGWLIGRDRVEADEQGQVKRKRPQPAGKPAAQWDVRMSPRPERPGAPQSDAYRSRQVNLPPLPPGVYLLTAGGGAK